MTTVEAIKQLSLMQANMTKAIITTIAILNNAETGPKFANEVIRTYELYDANIKEQWEKLKENQGGKK